MELNDKHAKEILLDPVDYRICLAKSFLEKLLINIPKTYDQEYFHLEHNVESYLFYSNLAIENLVEKINVRLKEIYPSSKYVSITVEAIKNPAGKKIIDTRSDGKFFDKLSIYKLRKKLDLSDKTHSNIAKIIDRFFSTPTESDGKIDITNSPLWILRELRNAITHSFILSRQVQFGTDLKHKMTSFLLRMTLEPYRIPNGKEPEIIGKKLCMVESNPRQFFFQTYAALVDFINEIEKELPKIMSSFQYRNQPNFEPES